MRLGFSKSIVLAFLIACPKDIRADGEWSILGGTVVGSIFVGLITWALWPESDETVIKNSENLLQNTLLEHDAFLKNMEAFVDSATSWAITENTLETIAQRITAPNAQYYTLKDKRQKLENSLNLLKNRLDNLIKEQYNPEKRFLYERAYNAYQSISITISRLKKMEDILHEHQDYFNFYTFKLGLNKKYFNEFNGMSSNTVFKTHKYNGEFPLMSYEQKLSSDIVQLNHYSTKLNRYPQCIQEVNAMYISLNKYHEAVISDFDYKNELLKHKEEVLKRKEKEQKKREAELKRKKEAQDAREFEQNMRGISQLFTEVGQEIKQETLQKKEQQIHNQQKPKNNYYQSNVNQPSQREVIQTIKTTIIRRTRNIAAAEIARLRNNPPCNPECLKPINKNYIIEQIVGIIQNEIVNISEPNLLLDSYTDSALKIKIEALAIQLGVHTMKNEQPKYEPEPLYPQLDAYNAASASAMDDFAQANSKNQQQEYEPTIFVPQNEFTPQKFEPSAPGND